jgi:hypothetical protein
MLTHNTVYPPKYDIPTQNTIYPHKYNIRTQIQSTHTNAMYVHNVIYNTIYLHNIIYPHNYYTPTPIQYPPPTHTHTHVTETFTSPTSYTQHSTSRHFTYVYSNRTWIPMLVTTFLTLFLKVLNLQGKDASRSAGNGPVYERIFTNVCSFFLIRIFLL